MLLLKILLVIYVTCLACCFVCSLQYCGHLLEKGWPLGSLVCDVLLYFVTFPCDVLDQMSYLIVSIPDLCLLPYFNMGTNKLVKGEKSEQRRDHLDVSSAIGDQI